MRGVGAVHVVGMNANFNPLPAENALAETGHVRGMNTHGATTSPARIAIVIDGIERYHDLTAERWLGTASDAELLDARALLATELDTILAERGVAEDIAALVRALL